LAAVITLVFYLYGSLGNAGIDSGNHSNKLLALDEATPLADVIRQVNIQVDKVQMAMLNHRAVPKDAIIKSGERLALFPADYPIYPDWNDFRL